MVNSNSIIINARQAAYLSLLQFKREGTFLEESLGKWKSSSHCSTQDYHFAQQIAYGTLQRELTLAHQLKVLSPTTHLKLKERLLLYSALYQRYFLSHVPLYAIVDETVKLAKQYCHPTFVKYANAILRKSETIALDLPQKKDIESLSTYYSYPPFFIEQALRDYNFSQAQAVFEEGNRAAQVMARKRLNAETPTGCIPFSESNDMVVVKDSQAIALLINSEAFYIQNVTPVALMQELAQNSPLTPSKILDLCASPGGKTLMAFDLYPKACLFCHDISALKIERLEQNLKKYQVCAQIYQAQLPEELFDLIIVDAPCSNTGVLNKRPEARWRLSQNSLDEHIALQKQLIHTAYQHLQPGGEIWYLTCSLLKAENEQVIEQIQDELKLKLIYQKQILPNSLGWDGGYGAVLVKG